MNYGQALEYVRSLSSRGIVPGLDSVRELCKRLGNPQKATKWIHVAGTNGKGSAVAYITAILSEAGYRVGCYVSPTIRDYRERICVNGGMISKVALAEGMTLVKEACDAMVSEGLPQPTPFEVETALAFWYFQKKKCDLGVLECGMGGLLDATNVIEGTLLEVITSIGMDHMQFLGGSIEKIAAQKAGIIKPGSAVVCMEQRGEVLKVIEAKAKKEGASLFISRSSAATKVQYGLEKQSFHYGKHGKLTIRLAGKFQIDNAVLAVDACEALKGLGIRISDEAIREGLLETRWDGRLTVVQKHPMMVIDGAHNEDAAQKLAKSIEMYFTNRRIIYIMGVLRDKDFDRIIELTHSYADQIITVTPPENPRALPALDLAQEVAKVHPSVTAAASLEEAVEMARLLADKDDVILAFGSLSYLGKLMDIVGYPAKTPK
ncbi:MAG: bifunctional folylpolyglutamate synthase/dihydrofolate synthase [Lachnospiraceae bacterium]|nr:bifunctional folylpolyglutamate synthase/dihydrofolate synthase [Lachnospiraceae bacterium]